MDETRWRKPARSTGQSNCVELHPDGAVRDSKSPVPMIRVDLATLVGAVRRGVVRPAEAVSSLGPESGPIGI